MEIRTEVRWIWDGASKNPCIRKDLYTQHYRRGLAGWTWTCWPRSFTMGVFHCCHEDSIWGCVENFSVWKAKVHFGLCGSQGITWCVLCQRMPNMVSIWMSVTLWNGSVMGSLPPARIAPGKVQCLVSVRAQLPKELCAAFWTSCYMFVQPWLPHTDTPKSCPKLVPTPSLSQTRSCWSFKLCSWAVSVQGSKMSVANPPPLVVFCKWSRTLFGWQSSKGDVHAAACDGTGWLSTVRFKRT